MHNTTLSGGIGKAETAKRYVPYLGDGLEGFGTDGSIPMVQVIAEVLCG